MSILSEAIKAKQWETAALCLLIGLARAASAVPDDAVEGVIDLLEASDGEAGG
jgi:hypothetical protein